MAPIEIFGGAAGGLGKEEAKDARAMFERQRRQSVVVVTAILFCDQGRMRRAQM